MGSTLKKGARRREREIPFAVKIFWHALQGAEN
jgi:hypothetical protein